MRKRMEGLVELYPIDLHGVNDALIVGVRWTKAYPSVYDMVIDLTDVFECDDSEIDIINAIRTPRGIHVYFVVANTFYTGSRLEKT